MESCAYRALLETVIVKITACGPRYDYPGDKNLVKLKDCTRDASRPSPSCQLWLLLLLLFFLQKKFKYQCHFVF